MEGLSEGAAKFAELARVLREVGSDLHGELYSAIGKAARPILDDVRQGMRDYMPNQYADELNADVKLSTAKRISGTNAGVTLIAQPVGKARKLKRVNAGLLTHPLFGDREHWFTQTPQSSSGMHPGFWSKPIERAQPRVREEILSVMRDIADRATRRL